MAKYAGLIENDFAAAPGISVTVFMQGCPHHCPGCYNIETWDFDGGEEFTDDVYEKIYNALSANGINRNLVIQGGEPLCPENQELTWSIIKYVKEKSPNTKVYLYTGYDLNGITALFANKDNREEIQILLQNILNSLEWIKVGPYMAELRDITLQYMGSSNQKIIRCPLTFFGKIDTIIIDNDEKLKGEGYESTNTDN